jgi:ATP-dependent Clp protease protease subunit
MDEQRILETLMFEEATFKELLKDRKILLNGDIDDTVIERVIMQILKFNNQDENIPVEKRKPITLYINSGGGDVQAGLVLCNVIENSLTPVHGIVLSMAASMAAVILLSCHKRYSYRFSSLLYHDGYFSVQNSGKKARQTVDFFTKLDDKIKEFVIAHSKITEQLYEEKASDEWWVSAEEALELGAIDEIIGK